MANITAADVSKLRKMTGAGMMDCKNALTEAEGNFDKAIEIIRKKGQAVASKRAGREASEGVVLAKSTGDSGAIIVLNCETDFVAKNDDFVKTAESILNAATEKKPEDLDQLKSISVDGKKINDIVVEKVGIIGEKIELSYYAKIDAGMVVAYIHPGNKLASLVGFNKGGIDEQVGKDIAMQIAAMDPIAIDEQFVPEEVKEKELEIGREQARKEGKPENMLDRIAEGKLKKFYKESTLLNQDFIKDNKMTIRDYLKSVDASLEVTAFNRFSLT